jgi:hypothetical protein
VSSALQKTIERQFLKWYKEQPFNKLTPWRCYLEGYYHACLSVKEIINKKGKK